MLWIWVTAMFGIFRFRGKAYWKWVGILFVWMLAATFLFQAGGTLEDPSGDGLITHQVRVMTNDGPGMALFAIVFLIAYYAGIIFIIRKLWQNGKAIEAENLQREWDSAESVSMGRKLGEAALVTAFTAAWVYAFMILPAQGRSTPVITRVEQQPQGEAPDPIARDVAAMAADLNRQGVQ